MLNQTVRELLQHPWASKSSRSRLRRAITPRLELLDRRDVPAVINVGDPGTTMWESYAVGSFDDTYVGAMERSADVDILAVPLRQGQKLQVTAYTTWNQNNRQSGLWPHIRIFAPDGQELQSIYQQNRRDDFPVTWNKRAAVDGTYYVGISARGNDEYNIYTGDGTVEPSFHSTTTGDYRLTFQVEGGTVPSDPPHIPQPVLKVSRTVLNFEEVTIRQTSQLSFKILNVGEPGSVLTGSVGSPTTPFYIDSVGTNSGPGNFSIPAGESINVGVRFSPLPTFTDPLLEEKTSTITVQTQPAAGAGSPQTAVVNLLGEAEGAVPIDFRLVARPASNPDDGILRVDYHFASTSGVVGDLLNQSLIFGNGIHFREVISVKGSNSIKYLTPRPFRGYLDNPSGGITVSQWDSGHTKVTSPGGNDAFIDDVHWYTASHPLRKKLERGSFTIEQRFEYRLPWVNNGAWVPVTDPEGNEVVFDVVRSVDRVRVGRRFEWQYSVRVGNDVRTLLLTRANRRRSGV